jgi:uncharacterized protein (TIGR04255 family)
MLRIDTEVPAFFQDRICAQFPNFTEESDVVIEVPPESGQQIPVEFVGQASRSSAFKNYAFATDDGLWRVNLTRTFLALTTKRYERWEDFRAQLQIPFNALMEIYSPRSFSRIGLRYVDVIKRSSLGLSETPWRELLQPHIAGILSSPEVADDVKAFEASYNIALGEELHNVRIAMRFVKAQADTEICLMIDNDFFKIGKTLVADAFNELDYLHTHASRLIRWAISVRLHEAMEPEYL